VLTLWLVYCAAAASSLYSRSSRFPYAIIFGPLPLLSWLFPWVGHLGITDSEGMVHDFAGPYFVEVDSFMVTPVRYFQLQPEELLMSFEGDGRVRPHHSTSSI
jgi:hypothetical protein